MKKIAVLASMAQELDFCGKYPLKYEQKHDSFEYTVYEARDFELIVSVCGTGKVSAALCTQSVIRAFAPDIVVSIGTCGALSDTDLLKVVIATDCVQHDFDTSPFSGERGYLTELKTISLKADSQFLDAAKKFASGRSGICFGRILSGDHVVVDSEEKKVLKEIFSGVCVEMEAGGIAQTCAMMDTPFAAVKGISDTNEDHSTQFRNSIDYVAVSTANVLIGIAEIYAAEM